jgi:hypothetical protein
VVARTGHEGGVRVFVLWTARRLWV